MMIRELANVWNSLLRYKLPQPRGEGESNPTCLLLSYPLVGLGVGAAWMLAAFLIRQLVVRPVAAGLVGGIALPLLFLWMIRGREMKAIEDLSTHLDHDSDAENASDSMPQLIAFLPLGWLAVTMFATGVLVFDAAYVWLLFVPILALTAHAESLYRSGFFNDLVAKGDTLYPMHWVGALGVALIIVISRPLLGTVMLGLLATWALTYAASRVHRSSAGQVNAAWLALALTELASVWIGVLPW